jgi:deazaflavin-dependent oxidoreductase (nitroreductase family)
VTSEQEKAAPLPPRWFIRLAWLLHRAIYRLTGGRRGLRPATDTVWGMLRLHTIGRTSGAKRTAIVGYYEDGPNLVTMAMNGWGKPEPAWWLNAQVQPEVTIDTVTGKRRAYLREATGDERTRLWARWATYDKGLDELAAKRDHQTAVVVIEPR